MSITIGTVANSTNQAGSSGFSFNCTPNANTKALVVVVTGVDSSAAESVISSVTFGGVALTSVRARYKPNGAFFHFWYLKNPAIALGAVVVTPAGACTDIQASAIPLISTTADTIVYDTGLENTDADTTHGFSIGSVRTGAMGIAAIWNDDSAVTDVAPTTTPTTGTLIKENDNGTTCDECAWLGESGGSVAFSWTKVATNASAAQGCTFYEVTTAVTLEDPTAGETAPSNTPALTFHGHQTPTAAANSLEYQLQVDDATNFDDQSFDLKYIDLYLDKNSNPTDNVLIDVRLNSFSGSSLGQSNPVDATTIPTSGSPEYVRFTFTTPISLTQGTKYYMTISRSGARDTTNYVKVRGNETTTYSDGGEVYKSSGVWAAENGGDLFFKIFDTGTTQKIAVTSGSGAAIIDILYGGSGTAEEIGQSFTCPSGNPIISSLSTDVLGDFEAGHPWDDAEVVTYTCAELAADTYYWRVRGKDVTTGVWGAWSTGAGAGYESFVVSAGATCALTGTVTNDTEADIVTGGSTIILTLTGDTFIAAGTGPIGSTANTQALIDGIDSAQSEANGWDAVVKVGIETTDVVRTSNTVATITLDAEPTYDITATETITATIPAAVLTGAAQIVASPTFTITPITVGGVVSWRNLLGVGI